MEKITIVLNANVMKKKKITFMQNYNLSFEDNDEEAKKIFEKK